MAKPPRLLIIAGSDSSGGAGIQADIKTACAFGVYAMTAVTAVTAQDTVAVHSAYPMPASIVRDQIACCLADIGADAIKIGMLGTAEVVATVADVLKEWARDIPLVLDPVLASTSGTRFLDAEGIDILKSRLIPLASVVTPNIPELEILVPGQHPDRLLDMGARAVLVKGGHGNSDTYTRDFLIARETTSEYRHSRLETRSTHGTGCTLATAIACGLAEGLSLPISVRRAREFVQTAIATAPGFGKGYGPLNHLQEPRVKAE